MIFTHVFVNVAMTVGLVPITGVPLPLKTILTAQVPVLTP